MVKEFDKQVLSTTIMGVVQSTFNQMLGVSSSSDPDISEKDIIEFNERMRVFPMEKFNGPSYVSVFYFYLSQDAFDRKDTTGTFVLFIKEDVVDKFLKAFNRSMKDAENESVIMDICGEMGNILAGNMKNELVSLGYADLLMSSPEVFKNHVPNGVQFDYDLFTKQEVLFEFWGQKCVAVDICMGYVPQK